MLPRVAMLMRIWGAHQWLIDLRIKGGIFTPIDKDLTAKSEKIRKWTIVESEKGEFHFIQSLKLKSQQQIGVQIKSKQKNYKINRKENTLSTFICLPKKQTGK